MCRIEERIYVDPDGQRRTYQNTFGCDLARRQGRTCKEPEIRTTYSQADPGAQDNPPSLGPSTPTAAEGYFWNERCYRSPSLSESNQTYITQGGVEAIAALVRTGPLAPNNKGDNFCFIPKISVPAKVLTFLRDCHPISKLGLGIMGHTDATSACRFSTAKTI